MLLTGIVHVLGVVFAVQMNLNTQDYCMREDTGTRIICT
jgi:hypothetical protein